MPDYRQLVQEYIRACEALLTIDELSQEEAEVVETMFGQIADKFLDEDVAGSEFGRLRLGQFLAAPRSKTRGYPSAGPNCHILYIVPQLCGIEGHIHKVESVKATDEYT